jgi:tRNA A58 N-methylase Trm61
MSFVVFVHFQRVERLFDSVSCCSILAKKNAKNCSIFSSQMVRKVFGELGIECIDCYHCDVYKEGYGIENFASAVFLDLPQPWEAIVHAKAAMKRRGTLCSFSPCMEQVQQTVETLVSLDFRVGN